MILIFCCALTQGCEASLLDKRASARQLAFSRADLSSPTQVHPTYLQTIPPFTTPVNLLLCSPLGSHAISRLVFRSGQRGRVRTEGHLSDWPLSPLSVRCSSRSFQTSRCVLVSSLPFPARRAQHSQSAVGTSGRSRFGEKRA